MEEAVHIPRRGFRELLEYRQVLTNLVARDLKVKYQRSLLGFIWTLLHPATMLAIYIVVFGALLQSQITHFWAYLIAGLLPFQFVISAVVEGSAAIRANANLIRKIYFPPEILVIATVTAKLVEFLLQLAVALVFLILLHRADPLGAHISLHRAALALPAATALLYLFALGLALPLAAWCVVYRDLEHIISLVMTAWFYVTPIFWSLKLVREHLGGVAGWFALNPAMDIVDLFRGPLYYGEWPLNYAIPGLGSAGAWGLGFAAAIIFFAGGYLTFNRSKRILAEVV